MGRRQWWGIYGGDGRVTVWVTLFLYKAKLRKRQAVAATRESHAMYSTAHRISCSSHVVMPYRAQQVTKLVLYIYPLTKGGFSDRQECRKNLLAPNLDGFGGLGGATRGVRSIGWTVVVYNPTNNLGLSQGIISRITVPVAFSVYLLLQFVHPTSRRLPLSNISISS